MTSLTNTKGTALSLSASPAAPPLKVSNSVQVPSLNASELDGDTSSAFLPASGTAANSSELGGQPASDYMTGTGQLASDTATVASGTGAVVTVPSSVSKDYGLQLQCSSGTAQIGISATGTTIQYWLLAPDGQPETSGLLPLETAAGLGGTTSAATWVVQVAFGSTMATTDWSAVANTNGTCTFAAQTINRLTKHAPGQVAHPASAPSCNVGVQRPGRPQPATGNRSHHPKLGNLSKTPLRFVRAATHHRGRPSPDCW